MPRAAQALAPALGDAAVHVMVGSQHSRDMLDALAAVVPQERLPARYCGAYEGSLQELPEEAELWARVPDAALPAHKAWC